MKKILFLFLTLLLITQTAKTDTIDICHIYYNQTIIREINYFGTNEIILNLDSIKRRDSITVKYFRDTPCSDCFTCISIENGKHQIIKTVTGRGIYNPISFSLKDLKKFRKLRKTDEFEIYYFDDFIKKQADKILIVRLIFE